MAAAGAFALDFGATNNKARWCCGPVPQGVLVSFAAISTATGRPAPGGAAGGIGALRPEEGIGAGP